MVVLFPQDSKFEWLQRDDLHVYSSFTFDPNVQTFRHRICVTFPSGWISILSDPLDRSELIAILGEWDYVSRYVPRMHHFDMHVLPD
jgi:hypothetical protein